MTQRAPILVPTLIIIVKLYWNDPWVQLAFITAGATDARGVNDKQRRCKYHIYGSGRKSIIIV